MILSQKGLVLRFMFIAFYRLKEDLLRDAGDIFLYTYMNSQITELYWLSGKVLGTFFCFIVFCIFAL